MFLIDLPPVRLKATTLPAKGEILTMYLKRGRKTHASRSHWFSTNSTLSSPLVSDQVMFTRCCTGSSLERLNIWEVAISSVLLEGDSRTLSTMLRCVAFQIIPASRLKSGRLLSRVVGGLMFRLQTTVCIPLYQCFGSLISNEIGRFEPA